jgi:hypothetical protein
MGMDTGQTLLLLGVALAVAGVWMVSAGRWLGWWQALRPVAISGAWSVSVDHLVDVLNRYRERYGVV